MKKYIYWGTIFFFMFMSSLVQAETLRTIDLEEVSALGTLIEKDSEVKKVGAGSIKITTEWPTTICLGAYDDIDVENAKFLYKADVKSEMEGTVMLEMWVTVDGLNYFSRGVDTAIQGSSDWETMETPFLLETGQNPEKVFLNVVVGGAGTIWIDNIILSKEAL